MLRSPVASTAAPGRCRPRREVSPGRRVCSGTRKSSRRTGRGAERPARSPQGCRLPCGSRSAASPPAPARPQAGRSSERFQRSQHILQQRWIDPSGYPHPGARELDLDRRCPSDVALSRHHHRDEIERRRPPGFRRSVCRLAQLLAPRIELVAMQPVAARDRTRHRVRSQALGDDLRLLLPAPPPPPLRPRQHLAAARALPINWQLTWQTIHLRLPLRETPSSARRHRLQRAVKASLTFHLLGHPGMARQRPALPLVGPAVSTTDARPRHRNLDRSERAGDPSLAMTVPVTVARRDTAPLGGRRALGRAGFAIAAPMPAFVASASQGGGQLLLDQLFDENPDPIPDSRLDRVGPTFPQKQRRLVRSRRAIRRHGVISAGATTPALAVERAGDYATLKFQPLPRRHLLERARTCVMSSGAKSTTSSP